MLDFVYRLDKLVNSAKPANLGDVLTEAIQLIEQGPNNVEQLSQEQFFTLMTIVDSSMARLYEMASRVDIGWRLFASIDEPDKPLTDVQALQLVAIARVALREAQFCFDNLAANARINPWGNTAISFYINSLCSNVTAWFLLDAESNKKSGFTRPGSLIRVLQPIGLAHLLDPIYRVLDKNLGSMKFAEAIRQIRNKAIVHTDFLPENIKELFTVSELHLFENKLILSMLWAELGNRILILNLQLLAIFHASGKDLKEVVVGYMGNLLGADFNFDLASYPS